MQVKIIATPSPEQQRKAAGHADNARWRAGRALDALRVETLHKDTAWRRDTRGKVNAIATWLEAGFSPTSATTEQEGLEFAAMYCRAALTANRDETVTMHLTNCLRFIWEADRALKG